MSNLPDESKAVDLSDKAISVIRITGGGFVGREFRGSGVDSQFGWQEMVWKSEPTRGGTFAFTNMDDIDVGLVARCEVNIKYMTAKDYMDLRQIIARERHFYVEFFDIDSGKRVTRDMYCSSNSRNKLHILDKKLLGFADIPITFVGTNLDQDVELTMNEDGTITETPKLNTFTIAYNLNGGTGTAPESKTDVTFGSQAVLSDGTGVIAPTGKHLVGWTTKNGSEDDGWYGLGQSITVWKSMTLYAWYENAQ